MSHQVKLCDSYLTCVEVKPHRLVRQIDVRLNDQGEHAKGGRRK
jgi:hypothetical protein